jgi:vitamin B12 transporter
MVHSLIFLLLVPTLLSLSPSVQETQRIAETKPQVALQHEVTVTANRVTTSVKETASSVTILTRQDLEKTQSITVVEALRDILGFAFTQNGPPGSSASALIRGGNSEYTKVMIDGMELNDPVTPGRTFDLSLLLIDNIDRIEIIKGPQSTLFGSDAMGGIIHIITGQGRGKPKVRFSTMGGSYGTMSGNAQVSGANEKLGYSAGAAYMDSQGFSASGRQYAGNTEKDGYRNLTLSGKLAFYPRQNLDIHLNARTISTRLEYDAFGGDHGDDPNSVQDYGALLLGGGARGLFARNRWESKLNVSYLEYDRKSDNPIDELHPLDSDRSRYLSSLLKLDWQNNVFVHESNTVTGGLEYTREQGESEYYSESAWGPYESLFPRQTAETAAVYVQDKINLSGRFFATVGGRYDRHSQAGDAITYRIAPGVFIERTATRIKATLGSGYKAPSLYQLNAPATFFGPVGNQELESERCLGWDLGIEQGLWQDRFLLGALYFSNAYKNLIDYSYASGYINVGEASTKGMELFLRAFPAKSIRLSAEYTLTDARDEDTEEQLLRRPRHKLTAGLSFDLGSRAHAALRLNHVGRRDDNFWTGSAPERVELESYTLVNAAASYDILPQLRLFCRLDNLLNQEYELIKGFGTPGFSAYLGFRWGR